MFRLFEVASFLELCFLLQVLAPLPCARLEAWRSLPLVIFLLLIQVSFLTPINPFPQVAWQAPAPEETKRGNALHQGGNMGGAPASCAEWRMSFGLSKMARANIDE